jgi:hypothetical protein
MIPRSFLGSVVALQSWQGGFAFAYGGRYVEQVGRFSCAVASRMAGSVCLCFITISLKGRLFFFFVEVPDPMQLTMLFLVSDHRASRGLIGKAG